MSFQISRLFRGRTNCLVPLPISRDLASSSIRTEGTILGKFSGHCFELFLWIPQCTKIWGIRTFWSFERRFILSSTSPEDSYANRPAEATFGGGCWVLSASNEKPIKSCLNWRQSWKSHDTNTLRASKMDDDDEVQVVEVTVSFYPFNWRNSGVISADNSRIQP